jgi:sulfite oxidase
MTCPVKWLRRRAKCITDIELTTPDAYDATAQRGFGPAGGIKTESRSTPHRTRRSDGDGGRRRVAQHRGIERVEVRVDDGEWNDATLSTQDTTDTWRQWRWPWQASVGNHTLQVRATDADSEMQPEQPVPPFRNGLPAGTRCATVG